MANAVVFVEKRNDAIKLQGMHGWQTAKQVKDLQVGDTIKWNYGYTSEVIELIPSKTGKMIDVILRSNDSGNIGSRRMGANRLVAIA